MLKPLSQKDEARLPPDLVQALREGRALALVGAGLSRALGFPSWTELLRELADRILQDFGHTHEEREKLLAKSAGAPEWVGEVLKHHSPDAYVRTLRRIFADYSPPKFSINHALLAAIPFRGYLTTNYDHLIEDYVQSVDSAVPFVATPFQNENPSSFIREDSRFILKIHGCAARDAGRLILASSEYFNLARDPLYERALAHLFQRYSIVTLGFGLADRDLTRFIEERRHLYGNRCPTIYALIPDTEITPWEMEVYRSAYNVVVLPVKPENGFAELSSILLGLYCLVHSSDSQAITRDIEKLLYFRYREAPFASTSPIDSPSPEIQSAQRALSVFQDPVPLARFASWMATTGLKLTTAHHRLLGQLSPDGSLIAKHRIKVEDADLYQVGLWVRGGN